MRPEDIYDSLNTHLEATSEFGDTEELSEANFIIPMESDYVDFGEQTEEWDVAQERPGLWENIRRKREKEGQKYRPAKPGEKDRPTPDQWNRLTKGGDEDSQMAVDQLKKMHDQLMQVMSMLPEIEFEEWTKDMISKAEIYIQNVYDFIKSYDPSKYEDEEDEEDDEDEYEEEDETVGLQYGKPPKNDPRKTPAPKKDQKKGSKKNKPDSAKDEKGKITFDATLTKRLQSLVTDHNKEDKGSKVTLGMLKAVYRRGAGAYSTSHHPKMSRDGWAMARVKAFLYLARNGKPSNPNYKQDNDLLPSNHPRSTKASEYQGRKVTLNKPFRTPGGPKKFSVYVKNEKGNVVKVNFGDPNMKIKKNIPERRRSFRARHNCDNPGPKWKSRYWACKSW